MMLSYIDPKAYHLLQAFRCRAGYLIVRVEYDGSIANTIHSPFIDIRKIFDLSSSSTLTLQVVKVDNKPQNKDQLRNYAARLPTQERLIDEGPRIATIIDTLDHQWQ
jgi:hypothetical protein